MDQTKGEKEIRLFDFKRPPMDPSKFWNFIAKCISFTDLKRRNFACRYYNGAENLKPPYIILANHASAVDFEVMERITHPYHCNNVASIEAFHDYPAFMFRRLGVIGKRKFIKDLQLIKNIKYSLTKLKNAFCIYPEARYTLDGTTSYLPQSLGKMLKLFKVPVALLILKGNFVTMPQWNKKQKHTHVEADFTQILTCEELETLTVDQINERIQKGFIYDDFAWQKENNIIIDHPRRADGLHSLLYQCPHCGKEHEMYSEGTELWCASCGKRWFMTELGELQAKEGETEFSHIPDWFKLERSNVRREVRDGTYHIEDDVRIDTIPNEKGFIKQGNGHFMQNCEGLTLSGTAYGKPFVVKKEGCEQESIHIEYGYKYGGDVFDIATNTESYWFYPLNRRDILTKVSIATEEIYFMHKERLMKKDGD